MNRRTRTVLLGLGLGLSTQAHAADLNLRPEGDALTREVQAALLEVAPKGSGLELELNTGRGPRMVWGAKETGVPFNPDVAVRVSGRGSNHLIELNPSGPLTRAEAVRTALAAEFELSEWTPAAARLRFSGADLNADGAVDLTDLALMMEALGGGAGRGGKGDLNGDRQIDRADLEIFSAAYAVGPLPTLEQPEAAANEQAEPVAEPKNSNSTGAGMGAGTAETEIDNTDSPPPSSNDTEPEEESAPASPQP